MEQLIYSGKGESFPVEVSQNGSIRNLRFGTEERQTSIDLERPHELQLAYTRWMMTALAIHPSPSRFLLVGLGGGAIAHFLLHHHPDALLDIVEKDREVISVAHSLFNLPRDEKVRVHHLDAVDFLCTASSPATYHVAFIDIFGAGTMAPPLYSPLFYRAVLDRLSPGGIMAVNLWSGDRALFTEAAAAICESCNDQAVQMAVKKRSNTIMLAFTGEVPRKTIRRAKKQAAVHARRYRLPFHRYLKQLRRSNKPGILWFFC